MWATTASPPEQRTPRQRVVGRQPDDGLAHPFTDELWADKTQRLEDIEVPAYVVDWTDAQIHSPGTVDGWSGIGSTQKWLEINGRSKWARFLEPEHADRLRMFYDTFGCSVA